MMLIYAQRIRFANISNKKRSAAAVVFVFAFAAKNHKKTFYIIGTCTVENINDTNLSFNNKINLTQ